MPVYSDKLRVHFPHGQWILSLSLSLSLSLRWVGTTWNDRDVPLLEAITSSAYIHLRMYLSLPPCKPNHLPISYNSSFSCNVLKDLLRNTRRIWFQFMSGFTSVHHHKPQFSSLSWYLISEPSGYLIGNRECAIFIEEYCKFNERFNQNLSLKRRRLRLRFRYKNTMLIFEISILTVIMCWYRMYVRVSLHTALQISENILNRDVASNMYILHSSEFYFSSWAEAQNACISRRDSLPTGARLEFKMLKTTKVQSSESNISIDKFYDLSFQQRCI